MAGVRAAGSSGEQEAGIIKNTDRIPSLSGTAAYRIPDELNSSVLGEVKNVSSLSCTSSLRDFAAYAQQEQLPFNLYVRGSTALSGPLQRRGRLAGVLVSPERYEQLMTALEDAEDVAAFDEAMAEEGPNIPWEQVKADLGWE